MKHFLFSIFLAFAVNAASAACDKDNELLFEQINHFKQKDYRCFTAGMPPHPVSVLKNASEKKPVNVDRFYVCQKHLKDHKKTVLQRTLISSHYVKGEDYIEFAATESANPCGQTTQVRIARSVKDTKDYKDISFYLRKEI